jgi:hypothetical protein
MTNHVQRKTLAELNAFADRVSFGNTSLRNCSRRELLEVIVFLTEQLADAKAIIDSNEKSVSWFTKVMDALFLRGKSVAPAQPTHAPGVVAPPPPPG